MALVHLVRHGRATGGWDVDPDPGLDDLGVAAGGAAGRPARRRWRPAPLPIVTSPLRRCRETAAPLAARWGVDAVVEPLVAEIPSPPGVPMGERVRLAARGDGRARGRRSAPRYTAYRDASPAASPRRAPTPSSCPTSSPSTPSSAPARRRPGRHPQPRQHVGDRRRDDARRAGAGRGRPRGRHADPVIANATLDWHHGAGVGADRRQRRRRGVGPRRPPVAGAARLAAVGA